MNVRILSLGALATNCILASDDDGLTLIFDPADEAERIMLEIDKNHLKPAAVILTHGHFDHFLAADALRKTYDIPVLISERETELLSDTTMNLSVPFTGRPAGLKADRTFRDGDMLNFGGITLKVLATPGHTLGSSCFYAEKEGILFSGDTLFCQSVGRTDFPTGSTQTLIYSILNVLYALPDETVLYPGHGPETTIGFEKENGMVPVR